MSDPGTTSCWRRRRLRDVASFVLVAFFFLYQLRLFVLYQAPTQTASKNAATHDGLDISPIGLEQCITVRFPGSSSMTIEQAAAHLAHQENNTKLSAGLAFVEDPTMFSSMSPSSFTFHMFHFLEFVVIAYVELHCLLSAGETLIQGSNTTSIHIPWIYVPLMTREEICGTGEGINCLVANLMLQDITLAASGAIDKGKHAPKESISVFGLDANDHETQNIHPAFKGEYHNTTKIGKASQESKRTSLKDLSLASHERQEAHDSMVESADAVMFIDRSACNHESINKMWATYIDSFPRDMWHADFQSSFGRRPLGHNGQLVVGYIDRQNTHRKLEKNDHEWLINAIASLEGVQFRHLHMEQYNARTQIQNARSCDVLIGMHGNGLSHVLWMAPRKYVIEFFWNFPFQYDYATASQLMQHHYLALSNGNVVNAARIRRSDPTLPGWVGKRRRRLFTGKARNATLDFILQAKSALQ